MRIRLVQISVTLLLVLSMILSNTLIETSFAQANHDIAITEVTPSKTTVRLRDTVNITVAIENQGIESETFDVTLYRGGIALETKTVTDLTSSQDTELVFVWNTTDTSDEINALSTKEKTYNVTAAADILSDETDTEDNTLTSTSKIRVISNYIAVLPERTVDETLTTDKNYTVSIYTDYAGYDVWGWNVVLTFNQAVLEVIEVRNGDLITAAKNPDARFLPAINNTIGEVSVGAFFYYTTSTPFTTSGPGILADVTFRVVGTGYSNITFGKTESKLLGYNATEDEVFPIIDITEPSRNHMLSGYFGNTLTGTVDISVVSVTPTPTSVTQGEYVNITVVVENQGTLNAVFDATVYYDYNPQFPGLNDIETKTAQSLEAGLDTSLFFTWNTASAPEGDHVITAVVRGVSGETDTNDNRADSAEKVTVRLVEARPLPITEIAVGVVVLIIVVVAITFVLRRKRSRERTVSEES